jgi:hypothetical protein
MRVLVLSCLAAAVCTTAGRLALAQAMQPVYVQYEGFVKNDDGTMTLSFGYFNTSDRDVTIPAGEDNGFVPPPADRRQPVAFLKGRHRSACVMVMPSGFDGNLRWRVRSGGTESLTTAKVLDPNYALEDASARLATNGLDLRSVARATCLQPKPLQERR